MAAGFGPPAAVVEHAGQMPVGIRVVGLLPQHALQGRQSQFMVAQFREHAAEAGAGFHMIGVEFERGVVALPRRGQVA